MKSALLTFFIVMILGALTLGALRADSGYVLIVLGSTRIEMSFWFGVILLVLAVFILFLAFRLLRGGFTLKQRFSKRSDARAQRRTTAGLVDFIEGNWKQAQRKLLRSAKRTETPLINYLAAARSAYEAGDRKGALELLHKAEQSTPDSDLAVALTQARMQLTSKRYEQCLATLERVRRKAPQHPVILDLLQQVYVALEDWESLQKLLPSLRAYGTATPEELDELSFDMHEALLHRAGQQTPPNGSEDALKRLHKQWNAVPRAYKKDPEMVRAYTQELLEHRQYDEAEALVHKTLNKQWDPALVRLYGLIAASDAQQQLASAQAWVKKHPSDPLLLLTLGRLSLRNQLWGRARDYLQTSLEWRRSPETCAELARLLASFGEHEKSTELYQQGLLLTTEVPALPQPRALTADTRQQDEVQTGQ